MPRPPAHEDPAVLRPILEPLLVVVQYRRTYLERKKAAEARAIAFIEAWNTWIIEDDILFLPPVRASAVVAGRNRRESPSGPPDDADSFEPEYWPIHLVDAIKTAALNLSSGEFAKHAEFLRNSLRVALNVEGTDNESVLKQAAEWSLVEILLPWCVNLIAEPVVQPEATDPQSTKPATGATATASSASPDPDTADAEFIFRMEGGVYFIAGFGESGRVPASYKGLRQIQWLLKTQSTAVPMLELIGAGNDDRIRGDRRSKQPVMDATAKAQARERLEGLMEEKKLADDTGNEVESERLQREINELTAAVTKATGRRGKSRDANNPLDTWRPAIFRTLGTAYEVLKKAGMERVVEHFENSISSESGGFIYRPAAMTTSWDTGAKK